MEKRVIGSYLKTFSLSCGLELTGSVNIYREIYFYAIYAQNGTHFLYHNKINCIVLYYFELFCVFKVQDDYLKKKLHKIYN